MKYTPFLTLFAITFVLTQCDHSPKRDEKYLSMRPRDRENLKKSDTLLGEPLFTTAKKKSPSSEGRIGVNAYIWRASLDTFSFMPFDKLDPFSGVITTHWHSPPGKETERFKANILIMDHQLRPDAVKVVLFHETYTPAKGWVNVAVPESVQEKLVDTVLTNARFLKHQGNIG